MELAEYDVTVNAVASAASHASRYIIGQKLPVDGGLSINGNVGHAVT